MGIKHLVGFCLVIIGMGFAFLLVPFLIDKDSLNRLFLICLGACGLVSLFFGALFLKKFK
jgi:hypothetical protein